MNGAIQDHCEESYSVYNVLLVIYYIFIFTKLLQDNHKNINLRLVCNQYDLTGFDKSQKKILRIMNKYVLQKFLIEIFVRDECIYGTKQTGQKTLKGIRRHRQVDTQQRSLDREGHSTDTQWSLDLTNSRCNLNVRRLANIMCIFSIPPTGVNSCVLNPRWWP